MPDRHGGFAEPATTSRFGPSGWGDTLALIVFSALLTACLETGLVFARGYLRGGFVWSSRDHLWMASIGYLLFFGACGFIAWLIARVAPSRARMYVLPFVLTATAAFSLALPFGQLSRWAILVLALGAGAQVARIMARNRESSLTLARRGAAVLALGVAAVSVVLAGLPMAREKFAMSRIPAAAGSPSILLIILDTVRASSLGIYGSSSPTTPHLEQWVQRATVFDHAYSTAPWTLPAHASMFTGLWSYEMDVGLLTPFSEPAPTVAEVLRDRGFATGGFVANHDYTSHDSGLTRGFVHYEDYRRSALEIIRTAAPGQTGMAAELIRARSARDVFRALRRHNLSFQQPTRWSHHKSAAQVNHGFLRWVDGLGERPFFAFLNYYDAHVPYRCPPPFGERFRCQESDANAYHGAIAYLDQELDVLFTELDNRGMLENTVVVITSDHGEHLGEQDLWGHGNSLFPEVLHVPLIVLGPDVPRGLRVSEPVSIRDLPVTFGALAGVAAESNGFRGTDLATSWRKSSDRRPAVRSGNSGLRVQAAFGLDEHREAERAAVADSLYYIAREPGDEIILTLDGAPVTANLTGDTTLAPVLRKLRGALR